MPTLQQRSIPDDPTEVLLRYEALCLFGTVIANIPKGEPSKESQDVVAEVEAA